jgi:uncharacterized GH25 family protein
MRPFLVLLLVLAALAALLFGVLSFLRDKPSPEEAPPPITHTADTTPPSTSPNLEKGDAGGDRATAPAQSIGERARATSGSSTWQYDNTLAGVVQNPQGQTLPGCTVALSTYVELVFVNDPVDTTQDETVRTDAQGRFAFHNKEPRSRYKLTIKHPKYTLKELPSVAVGESGTFEEPPITLAEGATLQGHVRDEAGNDVDGATLVLDGLMYEGAAYDPPDRMTATSDKQGYYVFANVPKGQRTLTVTAPGYGSLTLNGLTFSNDEMVPPRDIQLKIGEMIRGRVVCAAKGIPGAIVQALGFANTTQISRGQTTSDANGQFTFENLAPGEYNIITGARGYRFDGSATRIRTGTDNVVIEGFKEADVCGHVIDAATGAPMTNFTCRMRTNNGPGVPSSATEFTQSFSDPKGEYCMNGIPAGDYLIEASAPGYAPSFSASVTVARGQAPSGNVVRLTKGGSIAGRVVDATGKPVPRARITTHDKEWSDDTFSQMLGSAFPSNVTLLDVRCGEDGRFVLSGLTPEVYQMNIRAAGFTRYIRNDISVSEGEENNLGDIRLSHGGALRGTLFDPSGKPLVGGTINVTPDDNRIDVGYGAKSGADGKFLITNIAPGRYLVSGARSSGGEGNPFEQLQDVRNSQKPVTITEDNTSVVEMTLTQ